MVTIIFRPKTTLISNIYYFHILHMLFTFQHIFTILTSKSPYYLSYKCLNMLEEFQYSLEGYIF